VGAVYSTRFLLHKGPGGSYTVPAGKRVVIKAVNVVNTGATNGAWGLSLNGNPVFNVVLTPGQETSRLQQMLVANAGDTISCGANADVVYTVTGYLLDAT
jgi:hypothetical protein